MWSVCTNSWKLLASGRRLPWFCPPSTGVYHTGVRGDTLSQNFGLGRCQPQGHSIPGHPMGLTRPSPILTKLCRNDAFGWPSLNPKFYPNPFMGCWDMTFWTFDLFYRFRVTFKFQNLISQQPLGRSEWSWCCCQANHPNNSFLVLFPWFPKGWGWMTFLPIFSPWLTKSWCDLYLTFEPNESSWPWLQHIKKLEG